jgi:hypothetical protein
MAERVGWERLTLVTLLKPATQTERLQYQPFANVPVRLGYGLGCERLNDFTGHKAALYGFSSVVFHNPTVGLTLAVVGNESINLTTP